MLDEAVTLNLWPGGIARPSIINVLVCGSYLIDLPSSNSPVPGLVSGAVVQLVPSGDVSIVHKLILFTSFAPTLDTPVLLATEPNFTASVKVIKIPKLSALANITVGAVLS